MPTADKARVIEQTREWFAKSSGVVSVDYRGLKVKEMQGLRSELRKKGGELHVVKNTLFRLAAGEHGKNLPVEFDNGTTAYAFVFGSESEVAQTLLDYARTSKKLVVKGGLFGGQAFDAKGVETLSKLPSKEVLLSQVIGTIVAPLSALFGTIEAIYAEPIRTVYAVADKANEGVEAPATEVASVEDAAPVAETTEEAPVAEAAPAAEDSAAPVSAE